MQQTISISWCGSGRNVTLQLWPLAKVPHKLQYTIAVLHKLRIWKNRKCLDELQTCSILLATFSGGNLENKTPFSEGSRWRPNSSSD